MSAMHWPIGFLGRTPGFNAISGDRKKVYIGPKTSDQYFAQAPVNSISQELKFAIN